MNDQNFIQRYNIVTKSSIFLWIWFHHFILRGGVQGGVQGAQVPRCFVESTKQWTLV